MQVRTIRDLGRLIRARRDDARLTAEDVASMAGVSRRLLLEVEQGKRHNVGFSKLLRLLDALGLRLEVNRRGLPGAGRE